MNPAHRKINHERNMISTFAPPWTLFTNDYGFIKLKKKSWLLLVVEVVGEVVFTTFIKQILFTTSISTSQ